MPFLGVSTLTPPDPGGGEDPGSGGGGGVLEPVSLNSSPIVLTTSDGAVFDLADYNGYLAMLGRKGFDAAQYDAYTDESPMVAGEIFRSARPLPRTLTLPLYIRADTREDFLTRKRDLLSRLSPVRGLATLTIAESDGSRRSIDCYFLGEGAEGDTGDRARTGRKFVKYDLVLHCPEPYWRGAPIHYEFAPPSAAKFLSNPFLPFRVQSSQSFGSTTFDNPGDVMSYPVWTVVGPCSGGIILTRTTPGLPEATLNLSTVLTAAQTLVIDTRPDRLTIERNDGQNRWPDLADGSAFWEISPGPNLISVAVGGGGSTTRVLLDAQPRYETA